ncbi:DUF6580 family putative transport protein [Alienimonas californiensis]|uniref:Apolipoprotein N-acyltransferase n=1 Tax=Alienimonas californiensis TaxID=2527989 RepID=A0A517PEU7_9PLAN|nr:DUF6580 family putative transport protein [Alienimonas californiensis]QDT17897.1 hypothetical protein CA12_40330 [Alienimonas californiensis]
MFKLIPMLRTDAPLTAPTRLLIFGALIVLTFGLALLPFVLAGQGIDLSSYPWGFSPILPLGLYAAATLRSRTWAVTLPVAVWATACGALWLYTGNRAIAFPEVILWVFAGLALAACCGLPLSQNRRWWSVGIMGLGAGVTFFLVTNFGAWLGGEYARSWSGLWKCYWLALPFFRGTLLSLVVFLPALFAPATLRLSSPAPRSVAASAPRSAA